MADKIAAKKSELIVISLLTLLAFALRLHQLGASSLWYDELLELDVAQSPFWQIGPQLERHAAMPLDYYLLHGWIQLGRQEAWVRFPALFFGTLAVPIIYLLASRLFNKRVGYLAATLLAWASFSIYYSREVRPYALLLVLTMLSFLGFWQAYKTGQPKYWGWAMVSLVGAGLTHYFALFLLLPLGLFVGVAQLFHLKQKKYWQHTAYFMLAVLILLTIFTLNGRLRHLYNVGGRFTTVISQPETLAVPAGEKPNKGSGPPQTLEFFTTDVLMPLATPDPMLFLLYHAFLVIAVVSLLTARPPLYSPILLVLGWLFLPIILIYLFLLQRGTFFAVRYILYTLPAYLILIAYGIEILVTSILAAFITIKRHHALLSPGRLLLTSSLVLAITPLIFAELGELLAHYPADSREDWRAVGQLLQANAKSEDAVIAVKAEPVINWYYPPASAPFGTFSRSEPIWQAINQHERRWFVLSSYSFKRDAGLRNWLNEQHAVTMAIDRRVVVYIQQEGLTAAELLAQVRTFTLPQKALTYASLADQLSRHGDIETSRAFYQKAIDLAKTPTQKSDYEARLATLAMSH